MYASSPEQRRAARARELAAALYSEHYAELRAAARGHCGKWADPEDALQEALAIFIASFDPDAGSPPLPWLRLTLKRLCWAAAQQRRTEARVGIAGSGSDALEQSVSSKVAIGDDPADTAVRTERVRAMGEAMVQLPSEQRRTISLFAVGYSYSEIAGLTGVSPKQVDRRLQGARTALRTTR